MPKLLAHRQHLSARPGRRCSVPSIVTEPGIWLQQADDVFEQDALAAAAPPDDRHDSPVSIRRLTAVQNLVRAQFFPQVAYFDHSMFNICSAAGSEKIG